MTNIEIMDIFSGKNYVVCTGNMEKSLTTNNTVH